MNEATIKRFLAHSDMLAAVGVVLVVTMLVVPLPAPLLPVCAGNRSAAPLS